ncbi:conserved protein of unknown function [Candidatus Filomicrobium marinum]|uniref:Fe-S protein n=3 Tax=Filomicrobium TaxID=119044 RepID=A0A0D6JIX6_9HYPH|nr:MULTISPECIES: DUF1289 domain-containing protein [Filomicrobium]MCV0370937.1 DUF1289 domain-containing protein [Filomicrobium sp.]CFX33649.1 conserved protein of unknown function [Candidatus Filomicrobium marinum]CPR21903.1 conserved protein of unknown function [Candidatus Filomicrobium marinum]
MESPCINICAISDETEMCEGCYRTIDEIASWSRLTAEERKRIMALLPERKAKARV